jgi:peptidoglycan/LPS O-acetylase OafA/YrhL
MRATGGRSWYPTGYVWRRIGKILPPFYLSIVLFVVFYWARFHDASYFTAAWKWAVGLANFVNVTPAFNGSYWSLLVEAQFYLILPVLFWATRRLSIFQTSLILYLVLLLIPVGARYLVWPEGIWTFPDAGTEMAIRMDVGLRRFPCMLDFFAWGVLFAGFYVARGSMRNRSQSLSWLGYAGMVLLMATMILMCIWNHQFDISNHPTFWSVEISHWLLGIAAFLLLFFIFNPDCFVTRILSNHIFCFVGIVSYEWFLFHLPIVRFFQNYIGPSNGNAFSYLLKTIVPLLLTFGFSVLVYRWFSLPILNRIRDSLKKSSK